MSEMSTVVKRAEEEEEEEEDFDDDDEVEAFEDSKVAEIVLVEEV